MGFPPRMRGVTGVVDSWGGPWLIVVAFATAASYFPHPRRWCPVPSGGFLPLRGFLPIGRACVVVLGRGSIFTRFPLRWVLVVVLDLRIQRWAGDGLCLVPTPPLGSRRRRWRSGPSVGCVSSRWAVVGVFRPLRRSPCQHWVWGSSEGVWGEIKRQETEYDMRRAPFR